MPQVNLLELIRLEADAFERLAAGMSERDRLEFLRGDVLGNRRRGRLLSPGRHVGAVNDPHRMRLELMTSGDSAREWAVADLRPSWRVTVG
jgi:hypothetical protein